MKNLSSVVSQAVWSRVCGTNLPYLCVSLIILGIYMSPSNIASPTIQVPALQVVALAQ
jgi:hypothetical protein